MNRRELVRLLAGAVAVPVLSGHSTEELLALGHRLNARAAAGERALNLFDPHQRATVAAIAERIIPQTDTPGARAAGVPDFIELIVAEHYKNDARAGFLEGLTDVDGRSRTRFGRSFVEIASAQQDQVLTALENEVGPTAPKPPEKKPVEPSQQPEEKPAEMPLEVRPDQVVEQAAPFWHQIKFLTVYGYYTSKIGVTRELRSVIMPGRYDPCIATGIPAPRGR
jgi:gluconate 2-dehydrogenase gamma chain